MTQSESIANTRQYDAILDTYRTSKTSDERNTALRSLGRARQPELIQRSLALALSDEVKEQDIYMPISGLRTHPEGVEALFSWLTQNWEELNRKLPAGLSMLGSMVQICTSGFVSQEQKKRVAQFFEGRSTKGFKMSLDQSLDAIEAKSKWVERDREDVKKWIGEQKFEVKL